MGWIKKSIIYILTFLAVLFGVLLYYQNSVFIIKGPDNGFLLTKTEQTRYSIYLPAFYLHLLTGSIVLILGSIQLNNWIRIQYTLLHRTAGKIYIFLILIFAAPSGFVMSFYANGGWSSRISFTLLAILWWFFTWQGFRYARNLDWPIHREFMIRSYAMTFTAVTLRLYLFFFALAGFRDEFSYSIIVWLSWAPSIFIVEFYLKQKNHGQFFDSTKNSRTD